MTLIIVSALMAGISFAEPKMQIRINASDVKLKSINGQPQKQTVDVDRNASCEIRDDQVYKVTDFIKCMARKTGLAVIADRFSMTAIRWNKAIAEQEGEVEYFKRQLKENEMAWIQYEGIVNISEKIVAIK